MSAEDLYQFGKYRVEEEIGHGGFGRVFRAVDVDLGRLVALKIMDPLFMRDQRWVARFRREARFMASLDHPHIVHIYEIGETEGRLFLAMKLIDGPNLGEYIAEKGPLSWGQALALIEQIASALDYAHQQNIIHRDLKPGNILISGEKALLTDFGLAQMVESNSLSISMSGGLVGTYNYIAPEVFNNEAAGPTADVYALGCVIYEMLTGHVLFAGQTTAAIIGAHLKGVSIDEPLPETTPPGTVEVLQLALARDPLDRYATAGELAQDLQQVTADRLNTTYAGLEEAVTEKNWAAALALAADIRAQNPDYRDVVALEETAKRGQLSAALKAEAEYVTEEKERYAGMATGPVAAAVIKNPMPTTTMGRVSEASVEANPPFIRRVPGWALGAGIFAIIAFLLLYFGLIRGEVAQSPTPLASETAMVVVVASPTPTPSNTPTRQPTSTIPPSPTNIPTEEIVLAVDQENPTATETPKATLTATLTPQPELEISLSSVYLRAGPATVYQTIGFLNRGDTARIIARNDDSTWLNVEIADGTTGWLARSVSEIKGSTTMAQVPLAVTIPPRPTATSTPTQTQQPVPSGTPTQTQQPEPGGSGGGGGSGGSNEGNGADNGSPEPQPTAADPRPTAADPRPTAASP